MDIQVRQHAGHWPVPCAADCMFAAWEWSDGWHLQPYTETVALLMLAGF